MFCFEEKEKSNKNLVNFTMLCFLWALDEELPSLKPACPLLDLLIVVLHE